jgi:hypothetical protein
VIPRIILKAVTYPGDGTVLDLTALTGGKAAGEGVGGYTRGDWSNDGVYKLGGGSQLAAVSFNDAGTAMTRGNNNYPVGCTYTDRDGQSPDDLDGLTGSFTASSSLTGYYNFPNSPDAGSINAGRKYTDIVADQKLCRFHFCGKCEGGTFQARAYFADGSITATPLTLTTTAGHTWFTCEFVSLKPTTLTVEIRRTVANDSLGQWIASPFVYLEPAVSQKTRHQFPKYP